MDLPTVRTIPFLHENEHGILAQERIVRADCVLTAQTSGPCPARLGPARLGPALPGPLMTGCVWGGIFK